MKITQVILASIVAATVCADFSNYPLAFFAEVKGELKPLSGLSYFDSHVLSYRSKKSHIPAESDIPVEFTLKGNLAIAKPSSTPGYLTIKDGFIAYGPGLEGTELDFDSEWMLLNSQFFGCEMTGTGKHTIFVQNETPPNSNCDHVKIYLSRYDRATGFIFRKVEILGSQANGGKEWQSQAIISNSPLAFFAEFDNKSIGLSYSPLDAEGKMVSALSYGSSWNTPVTFTLDRGYGSTKTAPTPGYVGFYDGLIAFGNGVNRIKLYLNSDYKLQNGHFRSCKVKGNSLRYIFYNDSSINTEDCFDVEIVLKFYSMSRPATLSIIHDQGSSTVQTIVGQESHNDKPHVFVAEFDGKREILSKLSITLGNEKLNTFSRGNYEPAPVEFTLSNGYASTRDTTNSGYAGFYNGFIVYGIRVPQTKLHLDKEERLLNGPYGLCEVQGFERRLLVQYYVTSLHTKNCSEVNVFLLPYDKSSRIVNNSLDKTSNSDTTSKAPKSDPVAKSNETAKQSKKVYGGQKQKNKKYVKQKNKGEAKPNTGTRTFKPATKVLSSDAGKLKISDAANQNPKNDSDEKFKNGEKNPKIHGGPQTIESTRGLSDGSGSSLPKDVVQAKPNNFGELLSADAEEKIATNVEQRKPMVDGFFFPKDYQRPGDDFNPKPVNAIIFKPTDTGNPKPSEAEKFISGETKEPNPDNAAELRLNKAETPFFEDGKEDEHMDMHSENFKHISVVEPSTKDDGKTKHKKDGDTSSGDAKKLKHDDITSENPKDAGSHIFKSNGKYKPEKQLTHSDRETAVEEIGNANSESEGKRKPEKVNFEQMDFSSLFKTNPSNTASSNPAVFRQSVGSEKKKNSSASVGMSSDCTSECIIATSSSIKMSRVPSGLIGLETVGSVISNISTNSRSSGPNRFDGSRPFSSSRFGILESSKMPNAFSSSGVTEHSSTGEHAESASISNASKFYRVIKASMWNATTTSEGASSTLKEASATTENMSYTLRGVFSTASTCSECEDTSVITTWNTFSDYTTYCPDKTTVTITVCDKVCYPSSETSTTATTLNFTGTCFAAEIITVRDSRFENHSETAVASFTAKGLMETTMMGQFSSKIPLSTSKVGNSISKPSKASNPLTEFFPFANTASKNSIGVCILGLAILML